MPKTRRSDPAVEARCILACALGLTLVVDGQRTTLEPQWDVRCDLAGAPRFSVPADSVVAAAAGRSLPAELTVASGLGAPGSPARRQVLVLAGVLRAGGTHGCRCCDERLQAVRLELDRVTLLDGSGGATEVELRRFADPDLALNRGHLQRTLEHANDVHEGELRRAVAALLELPESGLLAASLRDLDAEGCTVQWVDAEGSRLRRYRFPAPVRTPAELTRALRIVLPPGAC